MKNTKKIFAFIFILFIISFSLVLSANAAGCTEHKYEPANPSELLCTGTKPVKYVCSVCGKSYTESEPFRAHSFKPVVKKAKWKVDGEKYDECSVCGVKDNREIIKAPYSIEFEESSYQTYNGMVTYEYTGKSIKPVIKVNKNSVYKLKEGRDFTVSFQNNINVGKATVKVKFIGDYSGTVEDHFMILPGEPKNIVVSFSGNKATVKWDNIPDLVGYKVRISKEKDSIKTVTTQKNSIVISDLEPGALYYGSIEPLAEFDTKGDYGYFRFRTPSIEYDSVVYNGKKQTPEIKIYDNDGKLLSEKTDYTLTYSNNEAVGVATAKAVIAVNHAAPKEEQLTQELRISYNILPQKVTGLKTKTAKTSSLTLSWTKVTGAAQYIVYQSADGKNWSKKLTVKTNSAMVEQLTAGQKYQYKVRASASVGYGEYSSVHKTQTLTSAPKELKVSAVATGSVKLSWKTVFGASGYIVYMSEDGKKWSKAITVNTGSAVVKSLSAGKKYQFKVVSVSLNGNSAYSSVLKTQTLTSAPTVTLTSSKKGTAAASWKKVSGASKYIVYKSTDGQKWTKVKETTSLKYELTKLASGKKIYVKVVSVNSFGKNSASSAVKKVTVK